MTWISSHLWCTLMKSVLSHSECMCVCECVLNRYSAADSPGLANENSTVNWIEQIDTAGILSTVTNTPTRNSPLPLQPIFYVQVCVTNSSKETAICKLKLTQARCTCLGKQRRRRSSWSSGRWDCPWELRVMLAITKKPKETFLSDAGIRN